MKNAQYVYLLHIQLKKKKTESSFLNKNFERKSVEIIQGLNNVIIRKKDNVGNLKL